MTDADTQAPEGTGAAEQALSAAELQERIQNHEREASQLETKLQDFARYEGENGFDSRAYKRDELRLAGINRELSRMYSMQNQVERRSDQWIEFAKRKAADFLQGRLPRIPENLRDKVRDEFLANFRSTLSSGIFQRPQAQNEQQIIEIIRDRFENAAGRVFTSQHEGDEPNRREGAPQERGLDRDDEKPPEGEDDPFEGDELARQLFQQYEEGRNKKHMTLADQQRERYRAMMGQKEEAKGGDDQ